MSYYKKSKVKFIILSLKQNILPFIFCLFLVCLILFSSSNLIATKNGLMLWTNSVLPSLLPFFIATELLNYTNILNLFSKFFSKFTRFLFNVPGIGSYPFLMGIVSGYPIGAKIVTNLYLEKKVSKTEAERLLSFTNNSGPLFIIGTVGIGLFKDTTIGFLLFITHLLACVTVGILFRFWKYNVHDKTSNSYYNKKSDSNLNLSNLGEVLTVSIKNSIMNVVMIGGFIVLFSVILSILEESNFLNICEALLIPFFELFLIDVNFIKPVLNGILELTNGLKLVANVPCLAISVNIIFTSFILGFGGFSVFFQIYSIVSKSNLSVKPYLIGKFMQGIFASIYTYIFIKIFPIFNLDLQPVFLNSNNLANNYGNKFSNLLLFFMIFIILFLFFKITFSKKSILKEHS